MRTIIAGSRDITDYELVKRAIQTSSFDITTVICGEARGVDVLGKRYAMENNIPIESYPVTKQEWKIHGNSAGYLRNEKMAKVADALIAVWDGKSNGTRHMINLARKYKLKVFVYTKLEYPISDTKS